jgi:hypothetical protein
LPSDHKSIRQFAGPSAASTSSALDGSSISNRSGCATRARARPTRWGACHLTVLLDRHSRTRPDQSARSRSRHVPRAPAAAGQAPPDQAPVSEGNPAHPEFPQIFNHMPGTLDRSAL